MRLLDPLIFLKRLIPFFMILFILLAPVRRVMASRMESLFWARDWQAMEKLISEDEGALSTKDRILYANSLWFQKRWKESLAVFSSNQKDLPPDLLPYMEMLFILGLERTGHKNEALERATQFLDNAPEELKYYVAYAMARLETNNRKWHSLMLELAQNKDQKKAALKGIMTFPEPDISHVIQLLKLEPLNKAALLILSPFSGDPENPDVSFHKGYALYLKGKYRQAIVFLGTIPFDDPAYGFKAAYFTGFSHYRLKNYKESLEIWKEVALAGKEYSYQSVRRIAGLARKLSTEEVLEDLVAIADSTENNIRLTAMYYLSTLLKEDEGRYYKELLLKEFPTSDYALRSLWNRGWSSYRKKEFQEALVSWKKALGSAVDGEWQPRLLYWLAIVEKRVGNDDYRILLDSLLEKFPFSIYTFRAFSNGGELLRENLPDSFSTEPSILESWGFIPYAMLNLQSNSSAASILQAAKLAAWMGDSHSAYLSASRVLNKMQNEALRSREVLRLLYPKPYQKTVMETAKRFSVEPALIWSIMRQESAFDPNSTSYAGACGLMQLMPETADDEARKLELKDYDIYDIDTNILLGTAHISWLLKRFKRLDWSIAAYNAGSGSVGRWISEGDMQVIEEWIEDIPYPETYGYLKRVLSNLYVYRLLYEREDADQSGEGE